MLEISETQKILGSKVYFLGSKVYFLFFLSLFPSHCLTNIKIHFTDASPANKKLVVSHGKQYGPTESSLNTKYEKIHGCLQEVHYIGPCGHQSEQLCSKAFEFASGSINSPECISLVQFPCPICNRTHIELECWLVELLKCWKILTKEQLNETDLKPLAQSLSDLKLSSPKAIKHLQKCLCKSQVPVYRTCSPAHVKIITCHKLLELSLSNRPLEECQIPTNRILACQHVLAVPCNQRNQNPAPVCSKPVDNLFTYPCGVHSVKVGVCSKYTALLAIEKPKCTQLVPCARYRCGHNTIVQCHLKYSVQGAEPFEYKRLATNLVFGLSQVI